ncbi:helix-turn-helix domain-containing protein [Nonlabens ponticola]|uniref:XRE family transcriptional regulator n=1 Tax=Nonlabens ponticola TaxID=2496866 RepID=A0A3S9MZW4_9FLAO|nr:helix-turn-helix transcriptional regulator [Nonlabens ponticola]AZQ44816.1 XRE family transcriptional regulator [Nonlabens ponticola]
MKEIMKQPQLGDYIARLRKEQGLTQEELVERCNINVRTIQRIEAGDVTPRSYTIKNILEALGSSFEDISKKIKREVQPIVTDNIQFKRASNGLLIGILGILYILISIPIAYYEISASLLNMKLLTTGEYMIGLIMYLGLITSFYLTFLLSIKERSPVMIACVIIFLFLEILGLIARFSWYKDTLYSFSKMQTGLAFMFQIIYGLSLVILAIPFLIKRKQFHGVFKNLGIILIVGGISHATFLLFPIGIIATLLFEILLIVMSFQLYQSGKTDTNDFN